MSKAVEFHSSPNTIQQKSDNRQPEVLQERIEKRAYELYEARGATPDSARRVFHFVVSGRPSLFSKRLYSGSPYKNQY